MTPGKFTLIQGSIYIKAPIAWSDEKSKRTFNKIAPEILKKLKEIGLEIHNRFPDLDYEIGNVD